MDKSTLGEISRLRTLTVGQLREEWKRLHGGEETRSRNKDFLWRRLAYRIQEIQSGSLSDRAKARLEELAPTTFVRAQVPPVAVPEAVPIQDVTPTRPKTVRDARLPSVGTIISRRWHGRELRLLVLEDGYELDGVRYDSLSEAARAVTGAHWNGKLFWGVSQRKRRS